MSLQPLRGGAASGPGIEQADAGSRLPGAFPDVAADYSGGGSVGMEGAARKRGAIERLHERRSPACLRTAPQFCPIAYVRPLGPSRSGLSTVIRSKVRTGRPTSDRVGTGLAVIGLGGYNLGGSASGFWRG